MRLRFGFTLCSALLFAQSHNSEALKQANLGVSLAHESSYRQAIQAYQRAIALDPTLPGIYLNLGLAWFKIGDFHEAISAFETTRKENGGAADEDQRTAVGRD